jgi:hypothetical protein
VRVNPHQHAPENCPTTRCRYCDGTAEMWMIGELALAPFIATGRVLVWLARHPVAAVILTAAALVAAAVHGAF